MKLNENHKKRLLFNHSRMLRDTLPHTHAIDGVPGRNSREPSVVFIVKRRETIKRLAFIFYTVCDVFVGAVIPPDLWAKEPTTRWFQWIWVASIDAMSLWACPIERARVRANILSFDRWVGDLTIYNLVCLRSRLVRYSIFFFLEFI